jgi:acetyl-CoA decarbonylase/synthase complex subunit gamma
MAMTGVQIFKLLPKTNCKKCGHPTCLAFAMKLAQRAVTVDDCPDISDEAKAVLGEASAPPIRPITMGAGDKAAKIGEETVLFRHEKKFVHPSVIALEIKDTDDNAAAKLEEIASSEIDRVGQLLRIEAVYLSNDSGDAGKLEALAKLVAEKAPEAVAIIGTTDAAAATAAAKVFAGKKPVIASANNDNFEAMAAAAKETGASLVVSADGVEAVSELTEKVKAAGVEDLILDSGAKTAKQIIENNVMVRRSALNKSFKPLGHPVITFAQRDDSMLETLVASLGIAKFSSIIVISSIEKWKNLALFTLRQNIYTDPQVPMQVKQDIYEIGDPGEDAPLIITTNFSLTYFIVSGEIENSKVPTRLAVMDSEGLSVLTGWAAGKFTATKITQFITESGVGDKMKVKELILPGYVAILSGALEDKLAGWKITVGPREANQIPAFLKSR